MPNVTLKNNEEERKIREEKQTITQDPNIDSSALSARQHFFLGLANIFTKRGRKIILL